MKSVIGALVLGGTIWAGQVSAQTTDAPQPEKCRVAEVNPVTNHTECIDPIGAPVEPLKTGVPCQAKGSSDSWTISNRCETTPAAPPAK